MFGSGVDIRVFLEVLESPHGLVGGFESVVHVKVVSKVKGYVRSQVLEVLTCAHEAIGCVGSVPDW